jgi:small GTP-binding protein
MSRTAAKIVLLGDHGVGKTSLVSRWVKSTFRGDQPATIGAAFSQREVMLRGQPNKVQIWDTAGEERYHSMAPVYSQGAVIVFDVSRRDSFNALPEWTKCLSQCDPRVAIVITGNKSDVEQRDVTFEEGESFAKHHGYVYFETSAKTGAGVDEAFGLVAEKALKNRSASENAVALADKGSGKERTVCC